MEDGLFDLAIGVGGILVVFIIAYITSVRKKKRNNGQDED
jgi:hypothetical protein